MAPTRQPNDQYLTNLLLKINAKVIYPFFFFSVFYRWFICLLYAISITCSLQLGGLNSVLSVERTPAFTVISKVPTIILGMDVSHGSPGQSDIPSIAAVIFYSSLFFFGHILFAFRWYYWYWYLVVSVIMVYLGGEFKAVASNLQIQSIGSHTAFKSWDDREPCQEKWKGRRWHYQVLILTLCGLFLFFSLLSAPVFEVFM